MKRWKSIVTLLAAVALAYVAFAPVANTQPSGWLSYLLQDPQGVVQFRAFGQYGAPGFIGIGTALPTAANSGIPPVNGELFLVRDNASANEPVLTFRSQASTAWRSIPISTLATNAPNVANSVWFGTGEVIFEGATADAFENEFRTADATVGVATFLLPDQAAAADIYPIMWSLLATNALQVANSVWFDTNQMIFEGATADGFETILQAEDADTADHTFQLPDNNAAADTYNLVFSVLDTNALDVLNSVWFDTNVMIYEGTADGFEARITAADQTVADDTYSFPDHGLAADTYIIHGTPDGDLTAGYFAIPDNFTHTEDAVMDSTTGANSLYVFRKYLPHPLTISDASVLLVDGGALAAADIVGVAIYYDADAGAQITEGTGDGTAAGLETIALADVTIQPGFYRFAVCSSDAVNLHLAGTLYDDEQIDVFSGVAGDITFGIGGNACVAGDPPVTTGPIATDDEAIPFILFH